MIDKVRIDGVVRSSDNHQLHFVANDAKASFTVLSPDIPADYNPQCLQWHDPSMVDYSVVPQGAVTGPPISFLEVKTIQEGTEWYKTHTKYPELVCDMLARYQWGDLKYTTPKEFRNQKKRTNKKKAKCPQTLQVKRGNVHVTFD
jgi:hypothetical protein